MRVYSQGFAIASRCTRRLNLGSAASVLCVAAVFLARGGGYWRGCSSACMVHRGADASATAVIKLRVQRGGLWELASLLASLLIPISCCRLHLGGDRLCFLQSLGLSGLLWRKPAEDFEDSRGA